MTTYARTALKAFFETGDVPTGTDYANLIDSCVNMVETGVQTLGGPLNPTELITSRVSAGTGVFTGALTVGTIISATTLNVTNVSAVNADFLGNIRVASVVTAGNVFTDRISASAGTFAATVSANALKVTTDVSADGSVYASAMRSGNSFFGSVGIVSAAGTTQGAATSLTFMINRGKGVTDGSATGFAFPANRTGMMQWLLNDGVSANLWPPTGGTINALGANTQFPLAANVLYQLIHIGASAYAVR